MKKALYSTILLLTLITSISITSFAKRASYEAKDVPNEDENCKSYNYTYMDYRKVTNTSSDQYALLNSDECYTDISTGIRKVGDRYCIAIGTGYSKKIGTRIDLVLENGHVIRCIQGDIKSDRHTDESNRFHTGGIDHGKYYEGDGSVAEMIIDGAVFNGISSYPPELNGNIEEIKVYGDDGEIYYYKVFVTKGETISDTAFVSSIQRKYSDFNDDSDLLKKSEPIEKRPTWADIKNKKAEIVISSDSNIEIEY